MSSKIVSAGLSATKHSGQASIVSDANFLNDWPDGTPKSLGNAFTAHMDGEPSIFANDRTFIPAGALGKSRQDIAARARERIEADGGSYATIAGLGPDSHHRAGDSREFHVFGKQGD